MLPINWCFFFVQSFILLVIFIAFVWTSHKVQVVESECSQKIVDATLTDHAELIAEHILVQKERHALITAREVFEREKKAWISAMAEAVRDQHTGKYANSPWRIFSHFFTGKK